MPTFILVGLMAVVFTAAAAGVQGLYWTWVAKREREAAELQRRLGMAAEEVEDGLFRERAADAAAEALGKLGDHFEETIASADSLISVSALLLRMGILFAVGSIVGLFMMGTGGVAVGLVFGLLPYLILRQRGSSRAAKLVEQLPDALDLMARAMQAGVGLSDAFRLAAEEMPMPVATEFGRIFEEVRLGREYREALTGLIDRNPRVFDVRLFVSSVLLQRETGGNLIEIFDNISSTIRARFVFQAKVKALTAEAKFSGLILGCLPIAVALLITVVNPEYLRPLVEDPLGNAFLLYCFSSYSFGVFIMRDISKVEV